VIDAVARRIVAPFVAVAVAVALIGALGALVTGAGLGRAVAVSFYVAGSLSALLGLAAGTHGPLRRGHGEDGRRGGVRLSTGEERRETVSISALLLVGGLLLLVIGLVVDPRARVV
jgi:hypothetical protein